MSEIDELRAEIEQLGQALRVSAEAHCAAVDRGWSARKALTVERGRVARVEALADHLDSLAPGDRHYAGLIRDALRPTS